MKNILIFISFLAISLPASAKPFTTVIKQLRIDAYPGRIVVIAETPREHKKCNNDYFIVTWDTEATVKKMMFDVLFEAYVAKKPIRINVDEFKCTEGGA